MKRVSAILISAALFLAAGACAQEGTNGSQVNTDDAISRIKDADDRQLCFDACKDALGQCKTYDDYEKLIGELKDLIVKQPGRACADIHYYMIAKTRAGELSYLTKKNDIESGRIYMSVNEKYYNEALESLDNADRITKSKDLSLDINFLRFFIFNEIFQPQKAEAVFNEIAGKIASYTDNKSENLTKLDDVSSAFRDKGMADYAMKLKFVYASKVDPESAKMLADDIKASADKYLDGGNIKESLSTYDTYLELAENYYDQDAMTARLMDIAEKYFNKKRYKEAMKYYSMYLLKYGSSKLADYASYKLALSYHNDRDYKTAVGRFEEFLKTYQNSVWFEKAFEALCRIYYETLDAAKAIEQLQKLIDAYPRRETRDYAYLLTGILYYGKPDYGKALDVLKKMQQEFPKSSYFYAADTLITDINEIKKGSAPSYSFGLKDGYRMWEAYMPIGAAVTVGDGAQTIENKDAKPGEVFANTRCGSKVIFTLTGLEDPDRFDEYWQDKEDQSRLPREIKTGTEKDLLFFTWSCADNGRFLDDKQAPSRTWQAPDTPGEYAVNININDIALLKPPDSGARKDPSKTVIIHVKVEK